MKEIRFSEEQLDNIQLLGQTLFDEDSSDPRSWNYKRNLIRPTICWWKILMFTLAVSGGAVSLYFLLVSLALPAGYALLICVFCVLTVVLVCLKRILICLIRIYQRLAPVSLRNKCRFEPSCSQYMILSLQKYGILKGLAKGIDRLKRCNASDGGFDYP